MLFHSVDIDFLIQHLNLDFEVNSWVIFCDVRDVDHERLEWSCNMVVERPSWVLDLSFVVN
jgi:hypothetical protein